MELNAKWILNVFLFYMLPLTVNFQLMRKLNKLLLHRQPFKLVYFCLFIPIINIGFIIPLLMTNNHYKLKNKLTFHEDSFECSVLANAYVIILKYKSEKYKVNFDYILDGKILRIFGLNMNLKEKEEYVLKKFNRIMKSKGIEVI